MRTWCEDHGSGVRLVVGVATEQRRCDEVALKGRGGVGRRDEEVQQPGVFSVTVLQFSFKLLLVILLKSLCTVCCFMVFWVLSEDTSCFYVDVMRDKLGSLQVSIGTFGWPFDVCMGVTLTLRFEFHGSAMWGRSIACWHCELVDLERLIVDVSGAVIWMVFVGYWEAGSHIRIEEDFYFTLRYWDLDSIYWVLECDGGCQKLAEKSGRRRWVRQRKIKFGYLAAMWPLNRNGCSFSFAEVAFFRLHDQWSLWGFEGTALSLMA